MIDFRRFRGSLFLHRGQRLVMNDIGCQQLVQRIALVVEPPLLMDIRIACAAANGRSVSAGKSLAYQPGYDFHSN
jgi:hypothetical protein